MIQAIGLMIGTYIFTRSVSVMSSEHEALFTKICAAVTLIVAMLMSASLLLNGMDAPSLPARF